MPSSKPNVIFVSAFPVSIVGAKKAYNRDDLGKEDQFVDIIKGITKTRKKRGQSQKSLAKLAGSESPSKAIVETDKVPIALDCSSTMKNYLDNLPFEQNDTGRSGDKVFIFDDYVLKVSKNISELRKERDKLEWLSSLDSLYGVIEYAEENEKGYLLKKKIFGKTLIDEEYLSRPDLLISVLGGAIAYLRRLDGVECPFHSETDGNDFIHGDLCLPNIIASDGHFVGFIDISNMGKGDREYDYAWLLWSLRYNLHSDGYAKSIEKTLGIEVDPKKYNEYVTANFD